MNRESLSEIRIGYCDTGLNYGIKWCSRHRASAVTLCTSAWQVALHQSNLIPILPQKDTEVCA